LPVILNGRIYRAATVPLAAALAIAALSLANRPAPLTSTLASDAFDGGWTTQELQALSREFPRRAAGSRADDALAQRVAQTLASLGFHLSLRRTSGETVEGERSLLTVIAARPGTTAESPIVVVAHRDAAGAGSEASLSGTAVLLELARVLANRETNRTIVLVSTSGGSGGDAGAASLASLVQGGRMPWSARSASPALGTSNGPAASNGSQGAASGSAPSAETGSGAGVTGGGEAASAGETTSGTEGAKSSAEPSAASGGEAAPGRPVDAAIVLGDLASERVRAPLVIPYSSAIGSAPSELSDTASRAIAQQAGIRAGSPSVLDQLVHLAVPLTLGEQGPLNAAGVPAVLIQASGERGPTPRAALGATRVEGLGSSVLSTIDALDAGPDIASAPRGVVLLSHNVVPGWAMRLVVAALLLPALLVAVDALARVRRRRERVGRWIGFTLACGAPFLAAALVLFLMGAAGIAGPTPPAPVPSGAVHVGVPAGATIALASLVLALCWFYWPRIVRVLGAVERPYPPAAGVGFMLVLDGAVVLTWLVNPFAALLMVPAAHLWLLVAAPELRPKKRWLALGLVLLGVCLPALAAAYYVNQFADGVGGALWTFVLLIVGGQVGLGTLLVWSISLGCVAAASMVALSGRMAPRVNEQPAAITIRGPLTYAGPGSLGGTESALRR
jgi:hypothetical protein